MALIVPTVGYLIWDLKQLRKEVNQLRLKNEEIAEQSNERRMLLIRLLDMFNMFRASAFEVVERSRDSKKPVSDSQIERLKLAPDPDKMAKRLEQSM